MTTIRPDIIVDRFRVLMHEADEGGYWGEVLGLPGCVSQGESEEELMINIREAIDAVLTAQEEMTVGYIQVEPTLAEKESHIIYTHEPETWTTVGS